ncbi:MAG: hypothetical protein JNL40_12290 [Cyclobacteriaceae bacterium]|nr:hypothetical protein [Cyclobacteriaceae bacterium]
MDLHEVERLLEKYWQAETSLEEEQQLREFFATGQVPAALKGAADLFAFFQAEQGKTIGQNFEGAVTKQLKVRREGKLISMIGLQNVGRIAAGIVVVVAATFLIRQEIRKSYPKELQDTYTDPQMAFEETKRALQMISNSFGKAKKEASKMQMLNEAEKKIQSKSDSDKISI